MYGDPGPTAAASAADRASGRPLAGRPTRHATRSSDRARCRAPAALASCSRLCCARWWPALHLGRYRATGAGHGTRRGTGAAPSGRRGSRQEREWVALHGARCVAAGAGHLAGGRHPAPTAVGRGHRPQGWPASGHRPDGNSARAEHVSGGGPPTQAPGRAARRQEGRWPALGRPRHNPARAGASVGRSASAPTACWTGSLQAWDWPAVCCARSNPARADVCTGDSARTETAIRQGHHPATDGTATGGDGACWPDRHTARAGRRAQGGVAARGARPHQACWRNGAGRSVRCSARPGHGAGFGPAPFGARPGQTGNRKGLRRQAHRADRASDGSCCGAGSAPPCWIGNRQESGPTSGHRGRGVSSRSGDGPDRSTPTQAASGPRSGQEAGWASPCRENGVRSRPGQCTGGGPGTATPSGESRCRFWPGKVAGRPRSCASGADGCAGRSARAETPRRARSGSAVHGTATGSNGPGRPDGCPARPDLVAGGSTGGADGAGIHTDAQVCGVRPTASRILPWHRLHCARLEDDVRGRGSEHHLYRGPE